MTKREQQDRVTEIARTMERNIERRRVVGSGGRVRTVAICEAGCWHGNRGQALKCKNAHWSVAGVRFGQDTSQAER